MRFVLFLSLYFLNANIVFAKQGKLTLDVVFTDHPYLQEIKSAEGWALSEEGVPKVRFTTRVKKTDEFESEATITRLKDNKQLTGRVIIVGGIAGKKVKTADIDKSISEITITLGKKKYSLGRLVSKNKKTINTVLALTGPNPINQILSKCEAPCGKYSSDIPFSIEWAGDLDGDNKLDLLLISPAKNSNEYFDLYISSKAKPGQLIRLAKQTVMGGI